MNNRFLVLLALSLNFYPFVSKAEQICLNSSTKKSNKTTIQDVMDAVKAKKDIYIETNYNHYITNTTPVVSYPENKKGPLDQDFLIGSDSTINANPVYGCVIKLQKKVVVDRKDVRTHVTMPGESKYKITEVTVEAKKVLTYQEITTTVKVEDKSGLIDSFKCVNYHPHQKAETVEDYREEYCSTWTTQFGNDGEKQFIQFGDGKGKNEVLASVGVKDNAYLAKEVFDQKRSTENLKLNENSTQKICSTKSI